MILSDSADWTLNHYSGLAGRILIAQIFSFRVLATNSQEWPLFAEMQTCLFPTQSRPSSSAIAGVS